MCNKGSGDLCDPDEVCSGVADQACPKDTIAAAGTVCRQSAGVCDPAEACTGIADVACPDDAKSTAVCRTATDECDVREVCNGIDDDCPTDAKATAGTDCGDPTDNACTNPDTCDGSGRCLPNNTPCGFVTDSQLCTFDVSTKGTCVDDTTKLPTGAACDFVSGNPACATGSTCVDSRQFRLIFTPDNQNWVAYKATASNPGQFFYNLFYEGSFPATISITIPYPFVTHGAVPVHVYDADEVQTNGCFVPLAPAIQIDKVQIGIADYLNGTQGGPSNFNCDQVSGPDGEGFCTFDVVVQAPASGKAYVNVHLDYGLKGAGVDANPQDSVPDRYDRGATASPWASYDAHVNTPNSTPLGALAIDDCQTYAFSHNDGTGTFTDSVQNLNNFKKISGAFGLASSSLTASGIPGLPVTLTNSAGKVVKTGVTDEDGYYLLEYKHIGRPALYTITVTLAGGVTLSQTVELRAMGWTEVNVDVETGTMTVSVK